MSESNEAIAKPQPTLKGYAAWVLNRLVEAKATTTAEVAAWIIERWVDENGKFLADEFQITRQDFTRRGKIVPYPTGDRHRAEVERVAEKRTRYRLQRPKRP